jgi:pentatricopeptide repeat protein
VKADRVVFNALIAACAQSGAMARAFDVIGEMEAEIHPIEPDHVTVGTLMKACAKAGQVWIFLLVQKSIFWSCSCFMKCM